MNRATLLLWCYGCVALLYALFCFLHMSASFPRHALRKSFTLWPEKNHSYTNISTNHYVTNRPLYTKRNQ